MLSCLSHIYRHNANPRLGHKGMHDLAGTLCAGLRITNLKVFEFEKRVLPELGPPGYILMAPSSLT
jgi:hypothetical protein